VQPTLWLKVAGQSNCVAFASGGDQVEKLLALDPHRLLQDTRPYNRAELVSSSKHESTSSPREVTRSSSLGSAEVFFF
jgi:hypothetical protein